jgi:hypothetical protein
MYATSLNISAWLTTNCGERSRHDPTKAGYGQQIVNGSSGILEEWSTCQLMICGLTEIKILSGMRKTRIPFFIRVS